MDAAVIIFAIVAFGKILGYECLSYILALGIFILYYFVIFDGLDEDRFALIFCSAFLMLPYIILVLLVDLQR